LQLAQQNIVPNMIGSCLHVTKSGDPLPTVSPPHLISKNARRELLTVLSPRASLAGDRGGTRLIHLTDPKRAVYAALQLHRQGHPDRRSEMPQPRAAT
jgi:hypothetical protein